MVRKAARAWGVADGPGCLRAEAERPAAVRGRVRLPGVFMVKERRLEAEAPGVGSAETARCEGVAAASRGAVALLALGRGGWLSRAIVVVWLRVP